MSGQLLSVKSSVIVNIMSLLSGPLHSLQLSSTSGTIFVMCITSKLLLIIEYSPSAVQSKLSRQRRIETSRSRLNVGVETVLIVIGFSAPRNNLEAIILQLRVEITSQP
jgi:hypothetical protein